MPHIAKESETPAVFFPHKLCPEASRPVSLDCFPSVPLINSVPAVARTPCRVPPNPMHSALCTPSSFDSLGCRDSDATSRCSVLPPPPRHPPPLFSSKEAVLLAPTSPRSAVPGLAEPLWEEACWDGSSGTQGPHSDRAPGVALASWLLLSGLVPESKEV